MKKTKWLLSISVLLAVMLLFISCQKEVADGSSNSTKVAEVNSWLETQKPATKPNKAANVDLLKANLDFSGLRIENRMIMRNC